MEQGSAEWFAYRLGKATASRIDDIGARTKTGWGAARENYKADLIAERLTGVPANNYKSQAMIVGTEREPIARAAYSFLANVDVVEVGFVDHPTIAMSGASPDGLVGDEGEGLVEIKCPLPATHINTLLRKTVPSLYKNQMQWQMACTSRQWCDFVSYNPDMPEAGRLFVKRLPRYDAQIAALEKLVSEFLVEVDDGVAALQALFRSAA